MVVALCDILVVRVALRFALIIVAPHLVFVHAEAENKRGDLRSAVWQLLELGSHIEVRISAVISHDIEAIKVAVSPGFGHGVVVRKIGVPRDAVFIAIVFHHFVLAAARLVVGVPEVIECEKQNDV